MKCDDIREKFEGYVDGDLRPTERLCVDVHLATCYLCREEMDGLKTIIEAASDAVRHPAPQYEFEALRARLRDEALVEKGYASQLAVRIRETLRWIAVAAAALLIVAAAPQLVKETHSWLASSAKQPALTGPLGEHARSIRRAYDRTVDIPGAEPGDASYFGGE